MRIWSALAAAFFAAMWFFASWRTTTCGYDCGIIPNEASGNGPAVVLFSLLSVGGFTASIVVLVVGIFIKVRAAHRPN